MAPTTDRPSLRSLDRRTVAIACVVALVAAIAAGIIAAQVLGGDSTSNAGGMSLTEEGKLDVAALRKVPLVGSDGKATTLAAIQSEAGTKGPTLVNLWQSTCAPCVAEMPLLDAAQDRHPGLTIVGIDPQETAAKAEEFAAKTKITYPWALDPKATFFNAAQAAGLPHSILLDEHQRFVAAHTGAFTSKAELDDFLAQAD